MPRRTHDEVLAVVDRLQATVKQIPDDASDAYERCTEALNRAHLELGWSGNPKDLDPSDPDDATLLHLIEYGVWPDRTPWIEPEPMGWMNDEAKFAAWHRLF